jgi:16S rRNA (guanine1516-N2)-methyltransferase
MTIPIYKLITTNDRLELHAPAEKNFKPIVVDFLTGKTRHRLEFPSKELLAKAIGYKKSAPPTVLDATAGLGGDSFLLASLGCQVTLIERIPMIAELLQDGLQRARASTITATIIARMQLIMGNSLEFLAQPLGQNMPDVVYLDPMYPERTKSALVKKELRVLREIVGTDPDAAELFPLALAQAKQRVVVKRPRHAPSLVGQKPDIIFTGTAVRFDVYLSKH